MSDAPNTKELRDYADQQITKGCAVPGPLLDPQFEAGDIVRRTPTVPEDDDLFIVTGYTSGGWVVAKPIGDANYSSITRREDEWHLEGRTADMVRGFAEGIEAMAHAMRQFGIAVDQAHAGLDQ